MFDEVNHSQACRLSHTIIVLKSCPGIDILYQVMKGSHDTRYDQESSCHSNISSLYLCQSISDCHVSSVLICVSVWEPRSVSGPGCDTSSSVIESHVILTFPQSPN